MFLSRFLGFSSFFAFFFLLLILFFGSSFFQIAEFGVNHARGEVSEIRCASIAPESSLFAAILKDFSSAIEKSTGIKIILYFGSVVGDETDIVKGLKKGIYDCAILTVNGLGFISPYFRIFDFPFLIKDEREANHLKKRVFPMFRGVSADNGYEFLGFVNIGFVHIFSKYPIETFEDFKGKSFWVWPTNIVQLSTFELLKNFGVSGFRAQIDELSNLAKDIDIVWFPKYAIISYGFWKDFKYMMREPLIFFMGGAVIKSDKFNALEEHKKEKIRAIATEYLEMFSKRIMLEEEEARKYLLKNGMKEVSFRYIGKLEELFKENVWTKLKGKYVPEWLFISVLEEIAKIRADAK